MKKIISILTLIAVLGSLTLNMKQIHSEILENNMNLQSFIKAAFAGDEYHLGCVYCGKSIDNCTCDEPDCIPTSVTQHCERASGRSETTNSGYNSWTLDFGFPDLITIGTTYYEGNTSTTEHVSYGTEVVCGDNGGNCEPDDCDA